MKKLKHKLTDRQQEVLNLILKGKNNQQIAEQLDITYGTAKLMCNKVFKKLKVNSKIEAMALFLNS